MHCHECAFYELKKGRWIRHDLKKLRTINVTDEYCNAKHRGLMYWTYVGNDEWKLITGNELRALLETSKRVWFLSEAQYTIHGTKPVTITCSLFRRKNGPE